ncbi:MAG: hypothetical protein ACYDDI_16725 [Candidatus Acidiferrales bacterium]
MEDTDELNEEAEPPGGDERLGEIEQRLDELESRGSASSTGLSLGYAIGMSLAIVLSWSRNASILWCILHGLLSWAYVAYFALTR